MAEIAVEDLKRALDILLARVADDGVVRVDREAFWAVPSHDAYDIYHEPSELTIGMVSQSMENIATLLRDPDLVVDHGLVWLAEILRAAGDEASGVKPW
jgi:hypothetical protein